MKIPNFSATEKVKATFLEVQRDNRDNGPQQDFAVLAPFTQKHEGRWKPKGCGNWSL